MPHRAMTPNEMEELVIQRMNAGAVGRNAVRCRCGHIDYLPNSSRVDGMILTDCLIVVSECIECRESSDPQN
jgi:hypothetical protein